MAYSFIACSLQLVAFSYIYGTMQYTRLFPAIVIATLTVSVSKAQQNDTKVQPGQLTLVEAYNQRTKLKGQLVDAETHFIIVWEGLDHPHTFAWLANGRTVNCSFTKASKAIPKGQKWTHGVKYYNIKTPASKIAAGDTLDVTPINELNNTVPIREQQRMNNTIFYTTGVKGIMYTLPVEEITHAEDVIRYQ